MADEAAREEGREDGRTPIPFSKSMLDRSAISQPLIELMKADTDAPLKIFDVIIDLNLDFSGHQRGARRKVLAALRKQLGSDPGGQFVDENKSQFTPQYVFARLTAATIRRIADELGTKPAAKDRTKASIYKIWPDFEVTNCTSVSIATVKADAAHAAFSARGRGIVWAVMDSGIDGSHPHFCDTLTLEEPLQHRDFTSASPGLTSEGLALAALKDECGHGTHVAGIIAGRWPDNRVAKAAVRVNDGSGNIAIEKRDLKRIGGMAPECKLLSLKTLDASGKGPASNFIAAIGYVQELNGWGRRIKVHGVNMSVGYDFKPEWFACGQSPLCVEVDRLVRSGVVVVVAAGNTGYGFVQAKGWNGAPAGLDVTINDPGNADLAITVGSTHREMPHVYGVSYFSSKGPTGDGRMKPDLLGPGEKIISCASSQAIKAGEEGADYREDSGTSMAAPHVSGVIAAFLSIRREFVGRPERVKEIFMSTATDLRRAAYFQGTGLVDLMRAIQSV